MILFLPYEVGVSHTEVCSILQPQDLHPQSFLVVACLIHVLSPPTVCQTTYEESFSLIKLVYRINSKLNLWFLRQCFL